MTRTILVVDDEEAISDLICDALGMADFRTLRAMHGMGAMRALRESPVDLVVLDIGMPTMDGFEVLERMRAQGDRRPVIILTARQDREDVRRGFDLGADDFVRKPFGIEELTLRVKAVLARTGSNAASDMLGIGDLRLDAVAHEVTIAGSPIDLSPTEFRLLEALLRQPGRVLTKSQLLGQVWGLDQAAGSSALETYVSYLRRKLGGVVALRTVRGVGYRLDPPDPSP